MPRKYPAEFCRKVLDLVEVGRPVAGIAAQLGVTGETVLDWWNQDLIDRGLRPGVTTVESVKWPRPASGSESSRPSWQSLAGPTSC